MRGVIQKRPKSDLTIFPVGGGVWELKEKGTWMKEVVFEFETATSLVKLLGNWGEKLE